jgi:hypothetical protein
MWSVRFFPRPDPELGMVVLKPADQKVIVTLKGAVPEANAD